MNTSQCEIVLVEAKNISGTEGWLEEGVALRGLMHGTELAQLTQVLQLFNAVWKIFPSFLLLFFFFKYKIYIFFSAGIHLMAVYFVTVEVFNKTSPSAQGKNRTC